MVDRFGPCPTGRGATAWIEAVGRVAQQRETFDQHGRDILGRTPQLLHDDICNAS